MVTFQPVEEAMKLKSLQMVIAVVFFLITISPIARAQKYSITDLGPLAPTAINAWAQVVGNYNDQAYIWNFGRTRPLGTLAGGTFSWAAAINDLGVVTGTADGPGQIVSIDGGSNIECSDLIQPFIWTRQMRGLGTVGPASDDAVFFDGGCPFPFYGAAINDRGQVVGYTGYLPDDFSWGFSWTAAGGMTLFGSSFAPSFANGISNTGQIVGQTAIEGPPAAASWKNGIATDLGGLPGFFMSAANGVNDEGEIVGWSTNPSYIHAVIWPRSGAIRDLGTLSGDTESSATKINLFGIVIGSSGNTVVASTIPDNSPFDEGPLEVVGRPFVWSERSGMRDLNTLIPAGSGWVLDSVADINIWGQIVGSGTRNGQPHGFLLTPRRF